MFNKNKNIEKSKPIKKFTQEMFLIDNKKVDTRHSRKHVYFELCIQALIQISHINNVKYELKKEDQKFLESRKNIVDSR